MNIRTATALACLACALGACSGDDESVALQCVPYSQGEALVTNGDTGERKIDGPILSEAAVDVGDARYIAVNVDGVIIAVVKNGLTASLDAASERATSFPQVPELGSIDDAGAKKAIECVSEGESVTQPTLESGFDVEQWRSQAIERFGPEEVYDDGSRDDYVDMARSLCAQSPSERAERQAVQTAGSLGEFVDQEFCPFV